MIFLLAIVPGLLAQQGRSFLLSRSLQTKSVLEETGNYVLNSILAHLLLLGSFRLVLGIVRSPAPSTLSVAMAQKQLASWARQTWLSDRFLLHRESVVGLSFWGHPRHFGTGPANRNLARR